MNRTSLKAKADKLFSLKVRERGYCELAGLDKVKCGGVLQSAHIIGRANHRLRWEEANALCLCAGHHVYYTHNPEAWREIIETQCRSSWNWVSRVRNEIWDKDIEKVLMDLAPSK